MAHRVVRDGKNEKTAPTGAIGSILEGSREVKKEILIKTGPITLSSSTSELWALQPDKKVSITQVSKGDMGKCLIEDIF